MTPTVGTWLSLELERHVRPAVVPSEFAPLTTTSPMCNGKRLWWLGAVVPIAARKTRRCSGTV